MISGRNEEKKPKMKGYVGIRQAFVGSLLLDLGKYY
jgi:hypothetical protein